MRSTLRASAAAFVLMVGFVTGGCGAPGSALTQVEFKGQINDAAGRPLGGLPIQICLPAGYGLAGLDAAMFRDKPGAYGRYDQWISLVTDGSGRFSYLFQPVTYSTTLMPTGMEPKRAPKPTIGLRTLLSSGQWFIVYVERDRSRALRFRENPVERTPLPNNAKDPVLSFKEAGPERPVRGWTAEVTATRP